MEILATERLRVRTLGLADAPFILRLLNEPSFIRFIADRGVRDVAGAERYLLEGPLASYERHGFGLWLAELKESGAPIGMCGLLRRDALPDVDIGYALLPEHWGRGYAYEAAAAVKEHAAALGLRRLAAIVSPDNAASIRLLERLGLRFERLMRLAEGEDEVKLFGMDL